MIIDCPECGLPISDKAIVCPHCGYPINPAKHNNMLRKSNKRRRLPNGFGQISEIKNKNLRKPFRAMVTIGKNENGRPICKPLKPESYFETYNDAYAALLEYNRNPYDLSNDITVAEVYERWSDTYFKKLNTDSSIKSTKLAWKYCKDIYNLPMRDLRIRHIKHCMNEGTAVVGGKTKIPSSLTKIRMKIMFNLMLDYAVEYEIIDHNFARDIHLDSEDSNKLTNAEHDHIIYTDDEILKLWNHVYDEPNVDMLLIQCYSGWRPREICTLELKDIDLEKWTFTGGMKTDAGKNRIVPIHTKIRELVQNRYENSLRVENPYLFANLNKKAGHEKMCISYYQYLYSLNRIIKNLDLNPEHRLHDARKHFITMAKKYGVDEYAIKYMVGHVITDITEKVYTDRSYTWLSEEIEKIK